MKCDHTKQEAIHPIKNNNKWVIYFTFCLICKKVKEATIRRVDSFNRFEYKRLLEP